MKKNQRKQLTISLQRRIFLRKDCFLWLSVIAVVFTNSGCGRPGERELSSARSMIKDKKFKDALDQLDRAILRSAENQIGVASAREAARVSFYEIKDFKRAVSYYKKLVLFSVDAAERMSSQKQIANIYFDQLTDYPNAVTELNRFIAMTSSNEDKVKAKMDLARAYYYQNNFIQAESEVEELIRAASNKDQKFDMMVLKGNIYLAKKDLQKASMVFKQLVMENPQKATRDNVAFTLAVAYEEMKDYKSAIEILESMKAFHPMPEYLDIRIKRLAERKKNQPGARGMRK